MDPSSVLNCSDASAALTYKRLELEGETGPRDSAEKLQKLNFIHKHMNDLFYILAEREGLGWCYPSCFKEDQHQRS